jgi:hypothetical protein
LKGCGSGALPLTSAEIEAALLLRQSMCLAAKIYAYGHSISMQVRGSLLSCHHHWVVLANYILLLQRLQCKADDFDGPELYLKL